MYKLTGVTKTYAKGGITVIAVQDADLSIADGEWLAIQGRTGSGKTTLLQLLGAMHHPDRGEVTLEGQNLARLPEPRLTGVRAATIGFACDSAASDQDRRSIVVKILVNYNSDYDDPTVE